MFNSIFETDVSRLSELPEPLFPQYLVLTELKLKHKNPEKESKEMEKINNLILVMKN